jgi:DNA-binding transcriptional regulator LsrR (DeoR family)
MPMPRVIMKKIREILRLKYEAQLSNRDIARILKISAGAVSNYTSPFKHRGIGWDQIHIMTDNDLEQLLFPTKRLSSRRELQQPDFPKIHQELKSKGVTL